MNSTPEYTFAGLGPDTVLDALDTVGLQGDGRLLALNSYENRVYQVGLDQGAPIIVKFYRPNRWSDEASIEEHQCCAELVADEIPVVAPMIVQNEMLHRYQGYRFAGFVRQGGRTPELDQPGRLEWIGRFMGRIHATGARKNFVHEDNLDIPSFCESPQAWLLYAAFLFTKSCRVLSSM